MLFALQHLAAVALFRPQGGEDAAREVRAQVARSLGYIDSQLGVLEAAREYTEQQEYDKMIPVLHDAYGEDDLAKLMAEGAAWSEDHAIADAMLL